ncbi:MAG: cyclin domain-containing protein [Nitrosopumilus sp.]|nr:cyclin domain-containing protein [Nitrosopumilus sp.]
MDRKINIIYKKFQFKLKLSQDTIDYAQRLHQDLLETNHFKNESPYLIVAICVYTVSRISEQRTAIKEIAEVTHIKEDDLRKGYEMVFDEIEASLKKL